MAFFDIPLNLPSSFHPGGRSHSIWNSYPLGLCCLTTVSQLKQPLWGSLALAHQSILDPSLHVFIAP